VSESGTGSSGPGSQGFDLDGFDLGAHYGLARKRLTSLVSAVDEPSAVPVPACPSWSVHDVVAHLVAVVQDALAGRLTGPPSDEETAAQVARRRGVPTREVLGEWAEMAETFEGLLTKVRVWPGFLDVLAHEHDVRGALGKPDGRDSDEMWAASEWLVSNWKPPVRVFVHVQDFGHMLGPSGSSEQADDIGGPEILTLTTTRFEAFRFRLGRRSRDQLCRMAWSGDPEPALEGLTIFGPAPYDVLE
jgi:hypothetical protein